MPVVSAAARALPRASRGAAAVVLGLILVFLFTGLAEFAPSTRAALVATSDQEPGSDALAALKAVIIVGPTHDLTAGHLQRGEALAQLAESYGMDVRRVFHPKATWQNVLANIQGANLVAYYGHGNGWPSPYGPFQEKTKNGFGLNPYEGAGKNNVEYYGANKIRNNIVLASNAVVLLNHLCYAAGNGESFMEIPTWDVAHQRVDNFAAGFLFVGAGAVFAYTSQSVGSVLEQLMTTDQTMRQIFEGAGFVGWDARILNSDRTPGTRNYLDPSAKSGFERAVSGTLAMSAADFRNGEPTSSPPSGDSSAADTIAPSVPTDVTTGALGYRRVRLTWTASTDDRAGSIRYRIFRNGKRIATVTDVTRYVDRPKAGTYNYKVRAVDAAGNKSPFSAIVKGHAVKGTVSASFNPDTWAPSTPTGLATESLGYRRVRLTWDASTDDRAGQIKYVIFRNGKRVAAVTDVTRFVDRPKAGTYKYKVRAVDGAGNKSTFSEIVKGHAIKGAL